jgi:hypothetical protein
MWNVGVVVIIVVACSWCDVALGSLWGSVFAFVCSAGLPFEVKILVLAVPSAFIFCLGGFFANILLRSARKRLWLLAIVLIGCMGNVLRIRISADASTYHRIFTTVVFALTPWFVLLRRRKGSRKGGRIVK